MWSVLSCLIFICFLSLESFAQVRTGLEIKDSGTPKAEVQYDLFDQSLQINNSGTSGVMDFRLSGDSKLHIDASGNLGVNQTSPKAKLDVSGAIKLATETLTCDLAQAGTLRFQSEELELCNGSDWLVVSAGSGGFQIAETITVSIPSHIFSSNCEAPSQTLIVTTPGTYLLRAQGISYRYTGNAIHKNIYLTFDGSTIFAAQGNSNGGYFTVEGSDILTLQPGTYNIGVRITNGSSCGTTSLDRFLGGTIWAKRLISLGGGDTPPPSPWDVSGNDISYTAGDVGIGTSSPTQKLDVSGRVNASGYLTNGYSLHHAKSEMPYSSVNALCPAGSRVIQVPQQFIGRTGSEICAADGASDGARTTCAAVKYVYATVSGSFGSSAASDQNCSTNLFRVWPWAIQQSAPNSRPDEWSNSAFAVCCS